MANEHREAAASAAARKSPQFPVNKVAAAVAESEVDGVLAALTDAGFPRDQIDVMTPAELQSHDEPIGGMGLRGLLRRFSLSLGDELEELEDAQEELRRGHTLILVPVHGEADQQRAHEILRMHGGHSMRYFGRWTIRKLEDDFH